MRSLRPYSVLFLALALPELGCFVSFDGYGPLDSPDASAGGASSRGGAATTGGASSEGGASTGGGGASSGGGTATGGAVNTGGAVSSTGGASPTTGGASATGGAVTTGGVPSTGGVASGGVTATGGAVASGGKVSTGGAPNTGGTVNTGGTANTGGTPATGGTVATGGAPATGGSSGITCPTSLAGSPLVEIPKPGGGIYCIDRTEVTNEAYAVFLASNPKSAASPAECAWNTVFTPEQNTDNCPSVPYDPAGAPKAPIACIDWCDAKRYCEWTGKRLCGAIGGGPTQAAKFADATHSEWYAACSKGGTLVYPYGNAFQVSYCTGLSNSGDQADDVASGPLCRGGYDGLYDMSGNVAEWEDSCTAASGKADACLVRGGSLYDDVDTTPSLACNSAKNGGAASAAPTTRRDLHSQGVGFRCCFDP
jgi:sulfatase modifying factor 1